jgi:D-glycero-alpha-D-manno-heptose-7-phosphate kinase
MIIVKTPFRISFAGGGSDIPAFYQNYPGATLSTTINKYVYVCINKNFHDQVRLSYLKTEIVEHYKDLDHTRARECLHEMGMETGLEIVTMADIPSKGTGLGSSSSFTVGLLKALHAYQGNTIDEKSLAELACKIEIDNLQEPIGKQDQYIASFGGMKFIQYSPQGDVTVDYVMSNPQTLAELESSIMLFYTGIQRSTNGILKQQVEGYSSPANIETVKKMVELAHALRRELESGHLDQFGQILHESWLLKKSLSSSVSDSEIDSMYNSARAAGALGGKLLGAGGGGFLMVIAPPERQNAVREALSNYRYMNVKFEHEGSKILFINKNII